MILQTSLRQKRAEISCLDSEGKSEESSNLMFSIYDMNKKKGEPPVLFFFLWKKTRRHH